MEETPLFCLFDGPENSPGIVNVALFDATTLAPTSDALPDSPDERRADDLTDPR